jgi:hypothetical protein
MAKKGFKPVEGVPSPWTYPPTAVVRVPSWLKPHVRAWCHLKEAERLVLETKDILEQVKSLPEPKPPTNTAKKFAARRSRQTAKAR